jgi:hypothetical protein
MENNDKTNEALEQELQFYIDKATKTHNEFLRLDGIVAYLRNKLINLNNKEK